MRNMSAAFTVDQVIARTKTVTRRVDSWASLEPGDRVQLVRKAMGLKKGEKVEPLAVVEILSVFMEQLDQITPSDVAAEGFPDMTPMEFVEFFCRCHPGCTPTTMVRRIEWMYLERRSEPRSRVRAHRRGPTLDSSTSIDFTVSVPRSMISQLVAHPVAGVGATPAERIMVEVVHALMGALDPHPS